jgi:hypothetical protein
VLCHHLQRGKRPRRDDVLRIVGFLRKSGPDRVCRREWAHILWSQSERHILRLPGRLRGLSRLDARRGLPPLGRREHREAQGGDGGVEPRRMVHLHERLQRCLNYACRPNLAGTGVAALLRCVVLQREQLRVGQQNLHGPNWHEQLSDCARGHDQDKRCGPLWQLSYSLVSNRGRAT